MDVFLYAVFLKIYGAVLFSPYRQWANAKLYGFFSVLVFVNRKTTTFCEFKMWRNILRS